MYHYSPGHKPQESFGLWMEDGLCRLYYPPPPPASPPAATSQSYISFSLLGDDIDMCFEKE